MIIKRNRSSRPEVFCKKGVLINFIKFTGKHLCQSLFLNKVSGLSKNTFSYRTPPAAASESFKDKMNQLSFMKFKFKKQLLEFELSSNFGFVFLWNNLYIFVLYFLSANHLFSQITEGEVHSYFSAKLVVFNKCIKSLESTGVKGFR